MKKMKVHITNNRNKQSGATIFRRLLSTAAPLPDVTTKLVKLFSCEPLTQALARALIQCCFYAIISSDCINKTWISTRPEISNRILLFFATLETARLCVNTSSSCVAIVCRLSRLLHPLYRFKFTIAPQLLPTARSHGAFSIYFPFLLPNTRFIACGGYENVYCKHFWHDSARSLSLFSDPTWT